MKRALSVWMAFLILLSLGQVPTASAARMGWCLVETEYLIPDSDFDVSGRSIDYLMGSGAVMWNYLQDTVADHCVVIDQYRTDDGGGMLARAQWQVEWEEPAAFLPAGEHASVTVEQIELVSLNSWTSPGMSAYIGGLNFYQGHIPNHFHQPNGGFDGTQDTSLHVRNDRQVMTSEGPLPEGEEGSQIALYISFGADYGMRYTYAWGAEPARPAAAATAAPFAASPFADAGKAAKSGVLWTNTNIFAVKSGAQAYYVMLDLEQDAVVISIQTYHALGAEPGELMLYAESGSQWGPFQAAAAKEQGGVKGACWIADTGGLELPAGRYAVADSDPKTWSCNVQSGYEGFCEVLGYIPGAATGGNPFASATRTPKAQSAFSEKDLVGLWLSEPLQSGEQMLLNILPDSTLEFYYCYYYGSGRSGVDSLLDGNWECLDVTFCGYSASETTLTLYNGTDSVNVMSLEMRNADTMRLTDEEGARFVLNRASQAQADSWRSWGWSEAEDPAYGVVNTGGTESDLLEEKLVGLWLSEPDGEGNQVMLDIWPGGLLELFYCRYGGSGEGNTQAILNAEWECLAYAPCSYTLSADAMYMDNSFEVNELAVEFSNKDTLYLTDEYEYQMVLHRTSSVQEDAWRSWAWGTINPQNTGESYDGENAALPGDEQLEKWLIGLWLSDADADGNQTLIHVLPGNRIELYPCNHYSEYRGLLDELTDGNWDFIGPEVFQYYATEDTLTLYHDDETVIWAMNRLSYNTILMENEYEERFLYERATPEQEADWLEWMEHYQF